MEKKIYKIRPTCEKYKPYVDSSAKSSYDLQMAVNKWRVQKALNARKKTGKKYKKPNSFVLILKLLAFYYALLGLMILLSKLGL